MLGSNVPPVDCSSIHIPTGFVPSLPGSTAFATATAAALDTATGTAFATATGTKTGSDTATGTETGAATTTRVVPVFYVSTSSQIHDESSSCTCSCSCCGYKCKNCRAASFILDDCLMELPPTRVKQWTIDRALGPFASQDQAYAAAIQKAEQANAELAARLAARLASRLAVRGFGMPPTTRAHTWFPQHAFAAEVAWSGFNELQVAERAHIFAAILTSELSDECVFPAWYVHDSELPCTCDDGAVLQVGICARLS